MTVIIKFKQEVRTKGDPIDWVLLAPPGESRQTTQTWHRVSKLIPIDRPTDVEARSDSYQAMKARWEKIKPAYDAWKQGHELPETGTPLAAWSGVSQEQADILKSFNIKTVEDVTTIGDSDLQRIPVPNLRQLKKLAGDYLEARPMADMQAELAAANERMAAMEEMLSQATEPKAKPKPKDKAA